MQKEVWFLDETRQLLLHAHIGSKSKLGKCEMSSTDSVQIAPIVERQQSVLIYWRWMRFSTRSRPFTRSKEQKKTF